MINDICYDINNIDNLIRRIDNIGCNTKRIMSKEKLQFLMYETINKEVIL